MDEVFIFKLEKSQKDKLRKLAYEKGLSSAEFVRLAIDDLISKHERGFMSRTLKVMEGKAK